MYDRKQRQSVVFLLLVRFFIPQSIVIRGGGSLSSYNRDKHLSHHSYYGRSYCPIYTALAGLWSVAVTDIIQAILMTVGADSCLPILGKTGGWVTF